MTLGSEHEIRTMTRADMDLAVDWAAKEGWNPGRHDADCFYTTDPNGYFMAFHGGEPIGCISAVAYDENFGFIGFFIVKPQYRGGRIGIRLGTHALDYLGPRNVGIDGVEKKVKNYIHHGFTLAGHTIRYEGRGIDGQATVNLRPIAEVPFDQLAAYDRRHFPAPRLHFLSRWIKQPDSAGFAVMSGPSLTGYGIVRACRQGYKIGPLFANNPAVAEELLLGLIAVVKSDGPVYLDVPEVNTTGVSLALRYHMKPVFKTARMYNRNAVSLPVQAIFGMTSFELG
ncbi:MAG: GNAT family N-acetyltransferase [Verrucomicrobia bacterium]|nr:GNAT family N-acetyltransferase [Verrucomicrobiota bacterium]MBU1736274.1 GNAT family N-acetyltransferase [Verrucomicrobiota bacterium]MBU1858042.1 GNAT family N-acetyltransferase [Verrucomicrobiota bacterium]